MILIERICIAIVFMTVCLGSLLVSADEYKVKNLYIEYQKGVGTNRMPLMPDNFKRKGALSLGLDTEYKFVYSNTRVTGMHEQQFRSVGLRSEIGVHVWKFDFFIDHESIHALDANYVGKYPNTNSIGFRLNLIGE